MLHIAFCVLLCLYADSTSSETTTDTTNETTSETTAETETTSDAEKIQDITQENIDKLKDDIKLNLSKHINYIKREFFLGKQYPNSHKETKPEVLDETENIESTVDTEKVYQRLMKCYIAIRFTEYSNDDLEKDKFKKLQTKLKEISNASEEKSLFKTWLFGDMEMLKVKNVLQYALIQLLQTDIEQKVYVSMCELILPAESKSFEDTLEFSDKAGLFSVFQGEEQKQQERNRIHGQLTQVKDYIQEIKHQYEEKLTKIRLQKPSQFIKLIDFIDQLCTTIEDVKFKQYDENASENTDDLYLEIKENIETNLTNIKNYIYDRSVQEDIKFRDFTSQIAYMKLQKLKNKLLYIIPEYWNDLVDKEIVVTSTLKEHFCRFFMIAESQIILLLWMKKDMMKGEVNLYNQYMDKLALSRELGNFYYRLSTHVYGQLPAMGPAWRPFKFYNRAHKFNSLFTDSWWTPGELLFSASRLISKVSTSPPAQITKSASNALENAINTAKETAADTTKSVTEGVADTISNVSKGVTDTISSVSQGFTDGMSSLLGFAIPWWLPYVGGVLIFGALGGFKIIEIILNMFK